MEAMIIPGNEDCMDIVSRWAFGLRQVSVVLIWTWEAAFLKSTLLPSHVEESEDSYLAAYISS